MFHRHGAKKKRPHAVVKQEQWTFLPSKLLRADRKGTSRQTNTSDLGGQTRSGPREARHTRECDHCGKDRSPCHQVCIIRLGASCCPAGLTVQLGIGGETSACLRKMRQARWI